MDSLLKMAIKSSKLCSISASEEGFVTSTEERRGGFGTNVGARMFKGASWVGSSSGGGTPGAGSGGGPLAAVYSEPMECAAAKLLPKGRFNR